MNKVALLLMTDGRRECIRQTVPSALSMLEGPITHRIICDDSGDEEYRNWLCASFPTFTILPLVKRQGFGGSIRRAWWFLSSMDIDYIFHLEDDFLFNETIYLDPMIKVLENNPHLYQIVLRRQAWSSEEKIAGGVIEKHPDAYIQKETWLEHRLYFTTNPGLYRKSLLEIGWPDGIHSEGMFTHKILNMDSNAQFGLWGQRTDKPRVHHIGDVRIGVDY